MSSGDCGRRSQPRRNRADTTRRIAVGACLLAVVGLGASACDVQLRATEVTYRLDETGIHLVRVDYAPGSFGAHDVPAGETVITIVNGDSASGHTMMLATGADTVTALPVKALNAEQPSDAPDNVLDISDPLAKHEVTFRGGALVDTNATASFHEYLTAGQHYFLLDPARLKQGYTLDLVPLPRG